MKVIEKENVREEADWEIGECGDVFSLSLHLSFSPTRFLFCSRSFPSFWFSFTLFLAFFLSPPSLLFFSLCLSLFTSTHINIHKLIVNYLRTSKNSYIVSIYWGWDAIMNNIACAMILPLLQRLHFCDRIRFCFRDYELPGILARRGKYFAVFRSSFRS